jgi:hypothetical protein
VVASDGTSFTAPPPARAWTVNTPPVASDPWGAMAGGFLEDQPGAGGADAFDGLDAFEHDVAQRGVVRCSSSSGIPT